MCVCLCVFFLPFIGLYRLPHWPPSFTTTSYTTHPGSQRRGGAGPPPAVVCSRVQHLHICTDRLHAKSNLRALRRDVCLFHTTYLEPVGDVHAPSLSICAKHSQRALLRRAIAVLECVTEPVLEGLGFRSPRPRLSPCSRLDLRAPASGACLCFSRPRIRSSCLASLICCGGWCSVVVVPPVPVVRCLSGRRPPGATTRPSVSCRLPITPFAASCPQPVPRTVLSGEAGGESWVWSLAQDLCPDAISRDACSCSDILDGSGLPLQCSVAETYSARGVYLCMYACMYICAWSGRRVPGKKLGRVLNSAWVFFLLFRFVVVCTCG